MFIHSARNGVEHIPENEFFEKYHSMMILRPEGEYNPEPVISFAEQQEGKPYDLSFSEGDDKFYCSELVVRALEEGNVEINLPEPGPVGIANITATHPLDIARSNLQTQFVSHNIEQDENTGDVRLIEE